MKTVKIGVIGTRRGATVVKATRLVPNHEITAMCDLVESRVEAGCQRAGVPEAKRYTDHKKMVAEANIDAVFIAVPPHQNAQLACECLEAGKHVLCEVPLSYNLEDCWRIALAVEKSGMKFQMAEQVRFAPYILAWEKMVADGTLGKIVFAQGEYLHGRAETGYFFDPETDRGLTYEQAQANPRARKTRCWNMSHPIMYLPHDLSPLLRILDDRVEKVTCMGTRAGKGYVHEWMPYPDFEVALMQTKKDTVMRLAAGFEVHTIKKESTCTYHWYHLMGTKGTVETNRANCDKMKLWLKDSKMKEPAELMWDLVPGEVPSGALTAGHGGGDYFALEGFVESIRNDTPTPMDVYTAADATVPALIAAQSAEQGSVCLTVPDLRPNEKRKAGQAPEGVKL